MKLVFNAISGTLDYITNKISEISDLSATKTIADTANNTFTTGASKSKLLIIETDLGESVLVFCDYVATNITIVSDPTGKWENSATPVNYGVVKGASSNIFTVYNESGTSRDFTARTTNISIS